MPVIIYCNGKYYLQIIAKKSWRYIIFAKKGINNCLCFSKSFLSNRYQRLDKFFYFGISSLFIKDNSNNIFNQINN